MGVAPPVHTRLNRVWFKLCLYTIVPDQSVILFTLCFKDSFALQMHFFLKRIANALERGMGDSECF